MFKPEEQATDPELTDREKDLKLFIDLPGGVVTAPALNVGKKNLECQSQTSPIQAYLWHEKSNINWKPKTLQYPDLQPFTPKLSYFPISSASSAAVPSYQNTSTSNIDSSNSDPATTSNSSSSQPYPYPSYEDLMSMDFGFGTV